MLCCKGKNFKVGNNSSQIYVDVHVHGFEVHAKGLWYGNLEKSLKIHCLI